jgi:hypothetical protein
MHSWIIPRIDPGKHCWLYRLVRYDDFDSDLSNGGRRKNVGRRVWRPLYPISTQHLQNRSIHILNSGAGMDIIRVHPKNFKALFYLYHGSAAVGLILLAGFMCRILPYNAGFIAGVLMVSIPFLMIPPELLIHIRDQKLIFRYRFNCSTISFKDISAVEASARSVVIKNHENLAILTIDHNYFKNIHPSDLSEYIRDLLSARRKTDPMKYTSVKYQGCRFIDWCKHKE